MSWAAIAVGAGTAVAGVAGAAMNKPDKVKPGQVNYKQDILSFVQGMRGGLPSVLNLEKKYRDKFNRLNLGDVSTMLYGLNGQQGLLALSGSLGTNAGKQLETLKNKELRAQTGQTWLTRRLMDKMSPEGASMVNYAVQDANQAQRAAQGLTPGERRDAMQFARESASDRGRVMDQSTMAAEILNRDSILTRKRQEAMDATQNAFDMSNRFYTQPGLASLNSIPQAYGAGQSYLNLGLGAIGSATPQMIDIGAGLNLGATNRQNFISASAANSQASAAQNAALMNMLGGIGSAYVSNI